ncbi:SH2 domain-containing protein 7 [Austrofundulus limnaeus]|uniref:SH2 domain-containing protein 7 n=1 Tax=Austrofundulus limnaeus TaxID=52670 RepID=A0A2I4CWZ3_AUSLI|nr:PREDICTED: SH2 domain-containing protein 7-like [Austrofundulus limnaeus]
MEAEGGGLKELVLRWFTEKQAPLILHNGNFPDWFQGMASRREAEDVLEDKSLGSFLIRLSDKTIGYILSYRGHDRCRHFVISQNPQGQFVIGGDSQVFSSLLELIEHYKVCPIQPFGEFLTCTSSQEDTDLYDVVNAKTTSGVSVQALRTLWDQRKDDVADSGKKQQIQQQQLRNGPLPAPVPALPPKFKNRKLTGTVSVDAAPPSQVLPPVPKRGIPLGFSLSGSLPDTTSYPGETQTRSNTPQRPPTGPKPAPSTDSFNPSDSRSPDVSQAESRSQSLPYLGSSTSDEDDHCNQLGVLFITPSSSPKRVTCQTYSIHAPPEALTSSRPEQPSDELEGEDVRTNPLYQSSEAPRGGPAQQGDRMYSEVPQDPPRPTDDTYELIPGEVSPVQNNTYESVDDMKAKKPKSTWGKSNLKWKNFMKK